MTTRMTTRTPQGLGPGKCDGSVGEDATKRTRTTFMGGGFVLVKLVIRICIAQWLNVDEPTIAVII